MMLIFFTFYLLVLSLEITLAISLDQIRPDDLDPNRFYTLIIFLKEFLQSFDFEKI